LENKRSSLDFLGYINTAQLLTGRRKKSLGNPSESTGNAFTKKDDESERNNILK
jgi:hypothetical protein